MNSSRFVGLLQKYYKQLLFEQDIPPAPATPPGAPAPAPAPANIPAPAAGEAQIDVEQPKKVEGAISQETEAFIIDLIAKSIFIDVEDEEKYKIEKTNLEFNNWISKQDLGFSRSPYLFCGTPSIEFISRSIQHIPWTKKPISVGIFGFPQTPVLRRLLSEIYPEFKFIYEPEVDLDQIDTFVVDNLDKDLLVPSNKTYYFSTENKTIIEIFFEKILPYRSSRWVLSDNNLWVCIFK